MFKKKKDKKFIAIYVIDDTFYIRKSIYEYLYKKPQNMDVNVDFDFVGEASLARELKDQLPHIKADLFFMDMELQDGLAWQMIDDIHKHLPEAQIIAMTEENTPETQALRKEYEHKVVAILEKPFQPNHLYEVFELAVKQRFGLLSEEPAMTSKSRHTQLQQFNNEVNGETSILSFNEPSQENFVLKFDEVSEQTESVFKLDSEMVDELQEPFNETKSEGTVSFISWDNNEAAQSVLEQPLEAQSPIFQFTAIEEEINAQTLQQAKSHEYEEPVSISSGILFMEDVYDDDEFESGYPKGESTNVLIQTEEKEEKTESESEKYNSLEEKSLKNEENKDFNLIFNENILINSPEEEKNLPKEEDVLLKEESLYQNAKKEESIPQEETVEAGLKESENIFTFDLGPTSTPKDAQSFDLNLEFNLDDVQNQSFEFNFDTLQTQEFDLNLSIDDQQDASQKNESITWDFNLGEAPQEDPTTKNEYFESPVLYTETSQNQTENFFEFSGSESVSEAGALVGIDLNQSNVSTQSMSPESVSKSPTSVSDSFIISPPRSKGPGVPTTPKEFGRFGIRK